MAQAAATLINRPAWVDLSSTDAAASRSFYGSLFGWEIEVNPDPQYGGYALAKLGGEDVGGIGPAQDPNVPTAWNLYIGTDDIDALAKRVEAAGGRVIAQPFDVGDQGRMAVLQDPCGAFISAWQGARMGGFKTNVPDAFSWPELNARGVELALPFYRQLFGWTIETSDMGEGNPPYHQFQLDGANVAGAVEMNPMVPAGVPSYWQVYFDVVDVDATYRKALDLDGTEMLAPLDFPGGRLAILGDPQGGSFGLLRREG